jgi:GNAT superfamily N-acetyltransferase
MGEKNQAIGRSRGGRTTKTNALTDGLYRPIAFLLTGGQVADCTAGDLLLEQMPASPILIGTRSPQGDASRRAPGAGEAQKLPSVIQPLVELEALVPGHCYVNILATYPEYPGHGVGAALLEHAEGRGRAVSSSGNGPNRRIATLKRAAALCAFGISRDARRPQVALPGTIGDWPLLTKEHAPQKRKAKPPEGHQSGPKGVRRTRLTVWHLRYIFRKSSLSLGTLIDTFATAN